MVLFAFDTDRTNSPLKGLDGFLLELNYNHYYYYHYFYLGGFERATKRAAFSFLFVFGTVEWWVVVNARRRFLPDLKHRKKVNG